MLDKEIIIGRIVQNPDLAFAKFLFVFDPLTCDSKSLGLMNVTSGQSNHEFSTEENTPQHFFKRLLMNL